jgi:chaperone required for assembly of F1-ATPase
MPTLFIVLYPLLHSPMQIIRKTPSETAAQAPRTIASMLPVPRDLAAMLFMVVKARSLITGMVIASGLMVALRLAQSLGFADTI